MARLKKKKKSHFKTPLDTNKQQLPDLQQWITFLLYMKKHDVVCAAVLMHKPHKGRSLEVFVFKPTLVQADSWNHSNILNCKFRDVMRQKRFLTVRKEKILGYTKYTAVIHKQWLKNDKKYQSCSVLNSSLIRSAPKTPLHWIQSSWDYHIMKFLRKSIYSGLVPGPNLSPLLKLASFFLSEDFTEYKDALPLRM